MATVKFLESGTDATQDLSFFANTATSNGTIASATDRVHTGTSSLKSNVTIANGKGVAQSPDGTIQDAGAVISVWVNFSTVAPSVLTGFLLAVKASAGSGVLGIGLNTNGTLQIKGSGTTGKNGSTVLLANTWYRITLRYIITATNNWSATAYINGVSEISTGNADGTLGVSVTSAAMFGIINSTVFASVSSVMSVWYDDIYINNDTTNTDPGNILVTAKRPFANGTTNGFTTQIGAGGSGYGSGHAPQVNEQPLSQTNGWSVIVVASPITEEYNVENAATGDVSITGATILGVMGWIFCKSSLTEADSIVVDGTSTVLSVTSTAALFTQLSPNPTTYPASTGTDIGMVTNSTAATASLYECGILIAYVPAVVVNNPGNTIKFLMLMGLGT